MEILQDTRKFWQTQYLFVIFFFYLKNTIMWKFGNFNSREMAMASGKNTSVLYMKDNEHSWVAQSMTC